MVRMDIFKARTGFPFLLIKIITVDNLDYLRLLCFVLLRLFLSIDTYISFYFSPKQPDMGLFGSAAPKAASSWNPLSWGSSPPPPSGRE